MAEPAFRLESAWQRDSFALESAAMEFWRRCQLLPADVDPRARSRQLAVIAFDGDQPVGVTTVILRRMPQVRAKLAMYRCSVAPEHRRSRLAVQLTVATRDLLEAWSMDNPAQDLQGLGCVIQGAELQVRKEEPHWPITGLTFIGYNTRGEQIRLVWFRHARIG